MNYFQTFWLTWAKSAQWAIVITHRLSLSVRPSFHNLLVNTVASTNINQSSPNLVKFGQNVYDHKSSDEFYNETNRTRTVQVICPWIWKFAMFDFVYTLASANIDQ